MKQNIIVIGGGNHHNALGVIRALGRRGYGVELITVGSLKNNYISASRYVTAHHALASAEELAAYLLFRPERGKKEVIVSCADVVTEHLNKHLNRLSGRYIIPGVSEEGRMVELMDKTTMIAMAAQHGIHAPETWHLPEDYDKVVYPCITKALVSSHGGKQDIVICHTQEDLDGFLQRNDDNVFVQRFVRKKEEVQFIGCAVNYMGGGSTIVIPGMSKVLRSQPNTNTGFLEYGPVEPFWQDTVERAKAYISDCGYSGLFSIEFLRGDDDQVYFLEINFRNDGNAVCVTEAGVNLPVLWVKACMEEDYLAEIKEPKKLLVMPEFQDFKLVLQRKIGIRKWISDWKRTDAFMDYAHDDKRPFFRFILNKLR